MATKGYEYMHDYTIYIAEMRMNFILPVCSDIAGRRIERLTIIQDAGNATFGRVS